VFLQLYQKHKPVYLDYLHEITNLSAAAVTLVIFAMLDASQICARHTAGPSGVNLML
jgi:hypothetical protein